MAKGLREHFRSQNNQRHVALNFSQSSKNFGDIFSTLLNETYRFATCKIETILKIII